MPFLWQVLKSVQGPPPYLIIWCCTRGQGSPVNMMLLHALTTAAACTQHCCPAAQIAKVMGARVVAVCRGDAKAAALRALGADAVVDTAAAGKDVPLRQLIKAWRPPLLTLPLWHGMRGMCSCQITVEKLSWPGVAGNTGTLRADYCMPSLQDTS